MKIAICGSMEFAKEMVELKSKLEELGHIAAVPADAEEYAAGMRKVESKWAKIEGDLIKGYYNEIAGSDAVLIANFTKNGIENYVGGAALIEMAFGHVLDKKVYLLNPIPKRMSYSDEIEAMRPEVLNGDLSLLKEISET